MLAALRTLLQRGELRQGGSIVLTQAASRLDQIRASRHGALERLGMAPSSHLGVIAAPEDRRRLVAAERGWLRPLGILEQTAGKALLGRRGLVAEHARDETSRRLEHAERRQLSTGEDKIADRDLLVDEL